MNKFSGTILTGVMAFLLIGGPMVTAGEMAKLENLKQPPLNTTMMGVLKGVSDYYGLGLSTASVYGLSGHAFLINIHTELCPSSPYVWNREAVVSLIENMGIKMTYLGTFDLNDDKDRRMEIEGQLREALDAGIPCSVLNMDEQVIDAYDERGFSVVQPWGPKNQFTPARLTYGTWHEFGDEVHVSFYTFEKIKPADRKKAILASLDYAIDMYKNPEKYSTEFYGAGPKAYDNWIKAAPSHGSEHGNWWNAVVWSECRYLASKFMAEIGEENNKVSDLCELLKDRYLKIAGDLRKISNKKMEPEEKIELLKEAKQLEADAVEKLEKLATALRS